MTVFIKFPLLWETLESAKPKVEPKKNNQFEADNIEARQCYKSYEGNGRIGADVTPVMRWLIKKEKKRKTFREMQVARNHPVPCKLVKNDLIE